MEERNVSMTQDEMILELITLLKQNNMNKSANEVFETAVYVDSLEKKLDAMAQELADVRKQLVKRMRPLRLAGPEIRKRIGRHFFWVQHLPRAPGIAVVRQKQLPHNRPVHLRVVAHHNRVSFGEILKPHYLGFSVKQPHQPSDAAKNQRSKFRRLSHAFDSLSV